MLDRLSHGTVRFICRLWRRPGFQIASKQLQNFFLRRTLKAAQRSAFYRERLGGVNLASCRTLEDLPQLGLFTRPDELAASPDSFLAVDRRRVRFVMASTGSSGRSKSVYLTARDWNWSVFLSSWGLRAMGTGPEDVVQVCLCFGKTAWMTGHFALATYEATGALVVPAGNAESTATQVETMRKYGTTILVGTPSYLWRMTVEAAALGPLRSLGLRQICTGAEPLSRQLRTLLEDAWGAEVFDSYGMMELGSLIGAECPAHDGFHTVPTIAVEVIDPVTTVPLPAGQVGELVYTTLFRSGSPLIRYRSGDLGSLNPGLHCACGTFFTPKIGPIVGRADDMVIIGSGENIYPEQFETALSPITELAGYQVVVTKDGHRDRLSVKVEATGQPPALVERVREALFTGIPMLRNEIVASGTIAPLDVEVLSPGTLQQSKQVKVRRVVDLRPRL
jgi:phenylacetate-CoA ligase